MMNDHVRSSDVKEYLEEFLEEQPSNETTLALMDIYRKHGMLCFFNLTHYLANICNVRNYPMDCSAEYIAVCAMCQMIEKKAYCL